MLSGTADLASLADRAPRLTGFDTAPEVLQGVETLAVAFEIARAGSDGLLPSGLHPTRPPVVTWLVQRVAESPWGAFALAQCRVECRSGLRPRGFLRLGVIDRPAAARALESRWGYAVRPGGIRLRRSYHEIRACVDLGAGPVLDVGLSDPMPLRTSDAYYVANMHLARTPRGLRLVQVDPAFEVERAERGAPILERFDAEAWESPGLEPTDPIAASFTVATVTLPALRYVCLPDRPAFEGTERVDAELA